MGYLHIRNLYQDQDILLFKECYALEKIHGTSAHIAWDGELKFFAGGCNHDRFCALFNSIDLIIKLGQKFGANQKVTIFGEVYGGKLQGMKAVYGEMLRFIVFDIMIADCWLCVPDAQVLAGEFGLEFVEYEKITADLLEIDRCRDKDSEQAKRNGMGEQMREGVVLRPMIEVTKNNGDRIISKHKRAEFAETTTPRKVGEVFLIDGKTSEDIAVEWVTPMRLNHVLDKFSSAGIEKTGDTIKAMIEDVEREGKGEVIVSRELRGAIGRCTASLFKKLLNSKMYQGGGEV